MSNELSLLSSHLSALGKRKPAGGGPEGVAVREEDVENIAMALGDACLAAFKAATTWLEGLTRTSVVKGLAEAIVKEQC